MYPLLSYWETNPFIKAKIGIYSNFLKSTKGFSNKKIYSTLTTAKLQFPNGIKSKKSFQFFFKYLIVIKNIINENVRKKQYIFKLSTTFSQLIFPWGLNQFRNVVKFPLKYLNFQETL